MPLNKKTKNIETNNRKTIRNILILFNILYFFLISTIVILFYVSIPLTSTKVLFIPKGSTNSIVTYLNKKGYELNTIDKTIIRFLGYPQSGWIDLESEYMNKAEFLNKLTSSKAAIKTITLIPGETAYFFLQNLAKTYNLSYDKLLDVYSKHAYKVDGNILAETYNLPIGMSEDHLLFYLFSYSSKKYKEFSHKIFGEYNKEKWYKYLAMASVIQKEAANKKEMPIVSSVIHNRIKRGMALQMDGTLNYGKYSHTKVTAKMIREDKSSYNTYKFKGIPKNPVCAVSLAAIKAAIFPAKTSYLYFVKDEKTKLHNFSSSYKNHVNSINKNRKIKRQTKNNKTNKIQNLWKNIK